MRLALLRLTSLLDIRIMVALHFSDTLVALALPVADRIHFIPSVEQLGLLARKSEAVAVAHIEVNAGNRATRTFRRLSDFSFEINLHAALTVLAFATVPLTVHKVTAVAVNLTDGGLQVMHIAFHFAIFRIFGAVFSATVLPALALMAKLPRRHDVFPLDPAGAVFIFTDFIAAGLQIDDAFLTLPVDFSAAVKVAGNVVINFYTRRFGLGKTIETFGECLA